MEHIESKEMWRGAVNPYANERSSRVHGMIHVCGRWVQGQMGVEHVQKAAAEGLAQDDDGFSM